MLNFKIEFEAYKLYETDGYKDTVKGYTTSSTVALAWDAKSAYHRSSIERVFHEYNVCENQQDFDRLNTLRLVTSAKAKLTQAELNAIIAETLSGPQKIQ